VIQLNVKKFNSPGNDWQDVGNQPVTASPSSINNAALITGPGNKLFLFFRNLNLGIYAKTFEASDILPVTLTEFKVSQQNNQNRLQWHTVSELDNRSFEIEHSTDGTLFTKIGEVAAQLPGTIPHDYSFIHAAPADGINFYRLKQIDINDNFTYSNIISIIFNQQQRSFITFFPNPVKDILHTSYSTDGRKEIIIRNIEGKEMKRVISTARLVDINVSNLPAGAYFISLYGDKLIETRSFVK
jgi:Secretion system C-terminal sorting domain